MHDKKTVWDATEGDPELRKFITSVSRVFGKDAISAVAVQTEKGVFTTDISLLDEGVRVQAAGSMAQSEVKKFWSSKKGR